MLQPDARAILNALWIKPASKGSAKNPCPFERCGLNAECSVRNHKAKCTCLPGYKGNPYDRCRQYECLRDPDCPTTKACRNEKCVDPCDCAQNADCTPRNHRGLCTCFSGYTGDPYGIRCTPSKAYWYYFMYSVEYFQNIIHPLSVPEPDPGCKTDAECPSRHACIIRGGYGKCLNPCQEFRPCAQNARCEVKDELPLRVMTCTCEPGFTGKGDDICNRIGKNCSQIEKSIASKFLIYIAFVYSCPSGSRLQFWLWMLLHRSLYQ